MLGGYHSKIFRVCFDFSLELRETSANCFTLDAFDAMDLVIYSAIAW
ncbi:hypothetical protein FDUTEX481_02087 [Tolypothrix sp. PCC 7601]|nr:hypothetical protein FDUTEX481_02087 [Tolypothrix sp. PCC 7601]